MTKVGIICEYNPFHNGHAAQIRRIREEIGPDCAVICLMSGNYVQRGEPAIFDKSVRAEAAILGGADLVLELPLTAAVSSAEGFAAGGVRILTALGCDYLCFGAETGDLDALRRTALANLDPAFDELVRAELDKGCSYAAARQTALERLGAGEGVTAPNDILAVEYWKALLRQNSPMRPLPILRPGSYHARDLDPEAPSATALRAALQSSRPEEMDKQCLSLQDGMGAASDWRAAVPAGLPELYAAAPIHTLQAGERAVLAILRTLPDEAFRALPFGSEGLWSKFMKNCRSCASVEEILAATKSKRYALARIRRLLLCAVLGLTADDLRLQPPYARILAFHSRGREALRQWKGRFPLVNAGQTPEDPAYFALETRAADLYSLFSCEGPRLAGEESSRRIRQAERPSTEDPSA